MEIPKENEIYAHHKHGVLYRVFRIVPHGHRDSTEEAIVVYQNITTGHIYYRTISDFADTGVTADGDTYQNFKLVTPQRKRLIE